MRWIIKKAREFQKNIYFCFVDYAKAFDFVGHSKLWKILQEMGIPKRLICHLRNLYAVQEATVKSNIRSDQISHSVMSDSLQPHESQHARPPCPSPTPGVHADSRPSSWWWHPAISSSVIPISSCPQSLPAVQGWLSLQSKGFSRVFSNTTVQKHQFFGAQLSSQSNSHIHTRPLERP